MLINDETKAAAENILLLPVAADVATGTGVCVAEDVWVAEDV